MTDSVSQPFKERRGKPRINCSYPATVRGQLPDGIKYKTSAILTNISAGGFYLRTKRHVEEGETLSVVVRLSKSSLKASEVPRLSASGTVLRVEPKPDGTQGVAMKLSKHRFL